MFWLHWVYVVTDGVNKTGDICLYELIYGIPTFALSHYSFSQSAYLGKVFFLLFPSSYVNLMLPVASAWFMCCVRLSPCLFLMISNISSPYRFNNRDAHVTCAVAIACCSKNSAFKYTAWATSTGLCLPKGTNQSSGKQSKPRDVKMSRSQSDNSSRWEPKLSQ